MKILIIGSGGREHALANAYARSDKVTKVFVAPGNDFMSFQNKKIQNLPKIGVFDFDAISAFAKEEHIDLVDVAQDDPLAAGLVDQLDYEKIKTFGPSQNAAEIEWNKAWARIFMQKYGLPIPHYQYFSNEKEAIKYVNALPEQTVFIKAAGLAAGKGVVRADNKQEAEQAILSMKQFGKSGKTFLIEDALVGEEFSFFAICDGTNFVITKPAQDHKTVKDQDLGPNTGGMGCVAPALIVTDKIRKEVEEKIFKPFMLGMQKEDRPFSGILYLGGMVTRSASSGQAQVEIVEFNARWGDPEAEVILPSIQTDYLTIVQAVLDKKLHETTISFDKKTRISIAGCAKGYPTDYSAAKGKEITGLEDAMKIAGITIYGAGIAKKNNKWIVNGGRVFHLVAEGNDIKEARDRAYKAMKLISIEGNNLHYRKDIGWRDLQRLETSV